MEQTQLPLGTNVNHFVRRSLRAINDAIGDLAHFRVALGDEDEEVETSDEDESDSDDEDSDDNGEDEDDEMVDEE